MSSYLLAFMGIGFPEMMILAVIILVLFGSARLPKLMRSVGQSVGEFQQGMKDKPLERKFDESDQDKIEN